MEELKCSICGCLEQDTPKFYKHTKFGDNLCNKHYLQLNRYGEIKDGKSTIKFERKCDICGTTEGKFRKWHKEGKYQNLTLCQKHHAQLWKNGNILDEFPSHKNKNRICEECGSDNDVLYCRKLNKMLCRKHYEQIWSYGEILEKTRFDKNDYEIKKDEMGEYVELILRNVKHKEVARAIIDLMDLNDVIKYKWRYECSWGYVTTGNSTTNDYIMLQNFILQQQGLIDHVDRNPLNNRRYNLLKSNKSLNALNCDLRNNNTSGITGVSWSNTFKKWRVYINWEGKRIELGYKENKYDAIRTRLLKEKELLSNLAPQRYLFEQYEIIKGDGCNE